MTAALLDRAVAPIRGPVSRPDRTPGQPGERGGPRLQVLDQEALRRRTRRRNALLSLFMAVLVGFFAVAFMHAELVAGQQAFDDVRADIAEAKTRHAALSRQVEQASAPAAILARATEIGLVPAATSVHLEAAAPLREVPSLGRFGQAGPLDADPSPTVGNEPFGAVRGVVGAPAGVSVSGPVDSSATPGVAPANEAAVGRTTGFGVGAETNRASEPASGRPTVGSADRSTGGLAGSSARTGGANPAADQGPAADPAAAGTVGGSTAASAGSPAGEAAPAASSSSSGSALAGRRTITGGDAGDSTGGDAGTGTGGGDPGAGG
jgi:cell division protein FtsL